MERLRTLFKRKPDHLLNIYFTAGFPGLHDTVTIINTLAEAGADLIEVGMPYSDPLADGPTIQQSGQVALQNGMTLPLLFDQIAKARQHTDIPLILMGYYNQVMQYGEEAFLRKCKEVGVDALILPDLPLYEYEERFQPLFEALDLGISFLITPQTPADRIAKIDNLTRGFIYMVSSASITGAKNGIAPEQVAYFKRIEQLQLKHPRLIGFGISSHATFQTACAHANGAIIGSAYIRSLEGVASVETATRQFVGQILNPS